MTLYGLYGDPCKSRMKVMRDSGKWRVFELAQPGQRASAHGDHRFISWHVAMDYANACIRKDRRQCEMEKEER